MKTVGDSLGAAKAIFELIIISIKLVAQVFGADIDTSALENIDLDSISLDSILNKDKKED